MTELQRENFYSLLKYLDYHTNRIKDLDNFSEIEDHYNEIKAIIKIIRNLINEVDHEKRK